MDPSFANNLELYEQQEQELRFPHMSHKDALRLGLILVEEADKRSAVVTIDITVNNCCLFHYSVEGARPYNEVWIRRKQNIVNLMYMSSIRASAVLFRQGKTMEGDWYLDPKDYAYGGGGFPIYLIGTGVVGTICVSGLPHEEDHQMIIDAVSRFLKE